MRREPSLLYRPLRMRALDRASTGLVERDGELRLLEQALSQLMTGQPGLLVIEGPAGIGKTSLLKELRNLGLAAGIAVRSSRGTVLEQTLAWSVARQLLTQPAVDLTAGKRGRALGPAAARAPAILGVGADTAGRLQVSEALHALYWLTLELSEDAPLVLIVDDVQWADRESIAYLNYLGNRLEDQAILLVVAIRAGEPQSQRPELDELRRVPGRLSLSPAPLTRGASEDVVGWRLGERLQPGLGQRFHELTAGNPLLLHELCRGFEGNGSGPADALERAETTAARQVALSVLARLARYPPPAADVTEAVAILGSSATIHRVSRLTGTATDEVVKAIAQLIEAEILSQADHTVEFVHPLVRRAVYEHLNEPRRQLRHAQAAALLREENAPDREIAPQLLHAMPAAEPWRVSLLRQAAREALSIGAPEAASTYLRRALIEPPRQDEAYELLRELGTSELHHEPAMALEHFTAAQKLAASTETRGASALLVAQAHSLLGDFTSALTILDQAVDELDGSHSPLRRQLDSARLVFARWDYGSQELRDELFTDLRARAHAGAELDRDERANLAHELAARGEDLQTAADSARWAIRNTGTLSGTDAGFVLQLTSVLVICDLCQEADEIAMGAVRDAESRGSAVDACAALTLATYCALRRGDMTEAVERARAALALDTGVWAIAAVAWLSEALAERSEGNQAHDLLREYGLEQLSLTGPVAYQHAVLVHHRARMRALVGERKQALADFLKVGELAEGWGIKNPVVLDWRSRAAGILIALDRRDEAAELAHEELRLAQRWGAASAVGTGLRAAGMADLSPAGTDLLREAVEVHAGACTRLEHAVSLVSLGSRLRRQRQYLEARDVLRQGLDVASRCGALLLANQARDELVAAGGKPRRNAIEGAEALTGRERRIAELAIDEHTNRQIAQLLFVSPRTVEHHLGNIYRKLGIQGRDELEAALKRT